MPNAPSDPAVMARVLAVTAHRVLDQAHPVRETTARVVPMATARRGTVLLVRTVTAPSAMASVAPTVTVPTAKAESDVPMVMVLSAVIAQLVAEKSVNGSPVTAATASHMVTASLTATAPSVRVLHAAIVPATRLVMGHVKGVATVNVVTMEIVRNAAMAIVVSGSHVKAENVANTSLAILATASRLATAPMAIVLAVMRGSVGHMANVLNGTANVVHMAIVLNGTANVVHMVIVLSAVIGLSMVIAHARMIAVSAMSAPN